MTTDQTRRSYVPDGWSTSGTPLATRPDFAGTTKATVRTLRRQLGHDLWMVTRIEGDDLVVLDCLDAAYGIRPGMVLPWPASLDWRMVHTGAPRVAPRVAAVPAYATAPLAATMPIGSYAGVPLLHEGRVFGTLTGLHPGPLPDAVATALPMLELLGEVLSTVLALEIRATQVTRRAERAEVEAHVDPLTQVGNRLAWTKVLADEEDRCRRYGRPACVISIDLDGLKRTNDTSGHDAGDRLLRAAALALRRVSRMCDQVARVGGDEFAVLAVESSEIAGRALLDRFARALADAGVEASLGMAVRESPLTLEDTWQAADAAMYRHKRRRLQDRLSAALAAPEVARRVVRTLEIPPQAVGGQ